MSFKGILIASLLLGIVIIGLINFAYQTEVYNDANKTILNDSTFDLSGVKALIDTNLSNALPTASSSKTSFDTESPFAEGGSLLLTSIVGVFRVMSSIPITMYNIIFGLFSVALGSEFAIVLSILMAILVITIIFMGWRTIHVGE